MTTEGITPMDWTSAGAGAILLAVVAAVAKLADTLIHRGDRRESHIVQAANDAIELWQRIAKTFETRVAALELLVDEGRLAERQAHAREIAGLEARLARHGEHVRSVGPPPPTVTLTQTVTAPAPPDLTLVDPAPTQEEP